MHSQSAFGQPAHQYKEENVEMSSSPLLPPKPSHVEMTIEQVGKQSANDEALAQMLA